MHATVAIAQNMYKKVFFFLNVSLKGSLFNVCDPGRDRQRRKILSNQIHYFKSVFSLESDLILLEFLIKKLIYPKKQERKRPFFIFTKKFIVVHQLPLNLQVVCV